MRARIIVTPKRSVLDPQGKAVQHGLSSLGFTTVSGVRIGKCIDVEMEAAGEPEARELAVAMCEKLLANTVIEEYRVEILPGAEGGRR
jgi:phosphoribosylformylglycinamidine synthase